MTSVTSQSCFSSTCFVSKGSLSSRDRIRSGDNIKSKRCQWISLGGCKGIRRRTTARVQASNRHRRGLVVFRSDAQLVLCGVRCDVLLGSTEGALQSRQKNGNLSFSCDHSFDALRPLSSRCDTIAARAQHADYAAKAGDGTILQLPLKSPLTASQIRNVFGFPRKLRDSYSLGTVLGAGSFGVVREARDRATGRLYAVKSIPKTPKGNKPTPRYLLKLQTEVDAMGQLGASLDAVFLKDVFEDDVSIHLVMELCEGGSVLDRLKDGEYSERQVAHIMRSVLRFLSQCHSKGLVYRDVKPENFMILEKDACPTGGSKDRGVDATKKGHKSKKLLGKDGSNAIPARGIWKNLSRAVGFGRQTEGDARAAQSDFSSSASSTPEDEEVIMRATIKATDFGLAIRHAHGEPPLKSRSGTPAYMAPEVINQRYNSQADVWSAGIMMWQLLTGRFPFWKDVRDCTLQQVWTAILTQDINFDAPELRQVSPQARELLYRMLERDPDRRITASEALHHEWLRDSGVASSLPLRSSVVQRLQRFATYSKLKQLVFRLIADEFQELPSSRPEAQALMEGLTVLFQELDVDSSGSLSIEELVEGFEHLGYDVSIEELEQLMARVDINKDGSLQLSEFLAGLVDWEELEKKDAQWDAWVDVAFQRLDKNHDGFISLASLEDLLVSDELTSSEAEEDVFDVRRGLDADDSYYDRRNSLTTSQGRRGGQASGLRDLSEETKLLEARRMLREADTNGDGRVSRDEFKALLSGGSLDDTLDQYDARLKATAPLARPDLASVDEELGDEVTPGVETAAVDGIPSIQNREGNKGALLETLESDGEKQTQDVAE